MIVDAKVEIVDTCTRYDVDPATVVQVRVGVNDAFVAPLDGSMSVGTPGVPAKVVKVSTTENADVPPPFVAFARQ